MQKQTPNRLGYRSPLRCAVPCAVALALCVAPAAPAATATVAATPAQTIKGWGCFPAFTNGSNDDENIFSRPAIQKAIYDMGVTFVRVELWNGYYRDGGDTVPSVTFNTTQGPKATGNVSSNIGDLVRQVKDAKAHGVTQYILSCWSAPASMKTLGSPDGTAPGNIAGYVDLNHDGKPEPPEWTFLRRDKEQAYCNFYVAALLYLRAHGAGLPAFVSVQNEPSVAFVPYQACRMEADQWRRIVHRMRATLDANGLAPVKIHGPDDNYTQSVTTDWARNPQPPGYLRDPAGPAFDTDPSLGRALPAYAFHTYDTGFLAQAVDSVTKHPRDVWMTEWNDEGRGDGDGSSASQNDLLIQSARRLACDMTVMPTNYWAWWVAWHKGDVIAPSELLTGDQTPILSSRYTLLRTLWKTVRPGWHFKLMSCDDPDIALQPDKYGNVKYAQMAAFERPDGKASVVLLVNPTAQAKAGFVVRGLRGAAARVLQSDADHDMRAVQTGAVRRGAATITTLPPRSVTIMLTR